MQCTLDAVPSTEALSKCAQASASGETTSAAVAALTAGLRALADAVEATPELLSVAAESMAEDFVAARAPPDANQVCSLMPNPDPKPNPKPDTNPNSHFNPNSQRSRAHKTCERGLASSAVGQC